MQTHPKKVEALDKDEAAAVGLPPEDKLEEPTFIAISEEQGRYIYNLLVEKGAKNIIEFGTSFGISTLYLGAAAQKNGPQGYTAG